MTRLGPEVAQEQREHYMRREQELAVSRKWSALWKWWAKRYRERAAASMDGHRQAQKEVRQLIEHINSLDDKRPFGEDERAGYVEDLRGRYQVLQMYIVDLERERAQLSAPGSAFALGQAEATARAVALVQAAELVYHEALCGQMNLGGVDWEATKAALVRALTEGAQHV